MDESEKKYMYQYQDHTPEERQECARKAGIASGKKRRERAEARKICQMLLGLDVGQGKQYDMKEANSVNDVKGKNVSLMQALILKQVDRAAKGDINSLRFLIEMAGQNPLKLDQEEHEEKVAKRNAKIMEEMQKKQAAAQEDSVSAIKALHEALKDIKVEGVDDE